jgi:hypothetical protein
MLTGGFSLLGWMVSFLGPGAPRLNLWYSPNLGARSDSDLGKILVVIAVVIGLCIALLWIFGRVKEYSVKVTRNAQVLFTLLGFVYPFGFRLGLPF